MSGWLRTRFHAIDDKKFAIETIQDDIQPILDRNKALQNTPQAKSDLMGHHLATIPNGIIAKWANEDGINILDTAKHGKQEIARFIRRKLADPDWAYLRTR